MENAVDALKMAFGIFVFVIAIAIAVSVIGQAKSASDVIFHFNDKTEFYTYITEEDVDSDSRIVGIETIIPTIYRYAKEQFAVTIYDKKGDIIVRYDVWTENIISDWKSYNSEDINYKNIVNRLNSLQRVVDNTTGKTKTINANKIISNLYEVKINDKTISVGAPWLGDNEEILKRIKHDIEGTVYENNKIKYTGKNLKQYKDNDTKFIEKFVEVTTSGETITDEEYSLETIKGNKKLEIIYIMQENYKGE